MSETPLKNPVTDSESFFAQWLPRLPYQPLIPMLCPNFGKSSHGDISPAANDLPPSSSDKDNDSGVHSLPACNSPMADGLSDAEDQQVQQDMPTEVHCLEEWKGETAGSPCITNKSSITSMPYPTVRALDQSRSPVTFCLETALRAPYAVYNKLQEGLSQLQI